MNSEREINLVRAGGDDVGATAFLHVTQLPHGLFPRLGRRFVRRWHRAQLGSERGVLLVARAGDDVVGFVLGSTDRRANVSLLIQRHRRELLTAGALALLTRPGLAVSFLRTRSARYLRRIFGQPTSVPAAPHPSPDPDPDPAVAVLEAVVVDYPYRGRGIGAALVDQFLAVAADSGSDRVELVTKADARGAAGFYEHRGWQRVGGHVDRDGDEVLRYRIAVGAHWAERGVQT